MHHLKNIEVIQKIKNFHEILKFWGPFGFV